MAEIYGWDNVITTDVGGTSFDIGLINRRQITTRRDPTAARMILGVPMIEVLSIGAGGGTMARIDPLTNRMQVGPDFAGSVPVPVCYGKGGTLPTVTDADLVLGYLNPDYFAGGTIKVDTSRVTDVIRTVLAEPLGLSIIEAADGIKRYHRHQDAHRHGWSRGSPRFQPLVLLILLGGLRRRPNTWCWLHRGRAARRRADASLFGRLQCLWLVVGGL